MKPERRPKPVHRLHCFQVREWVLRRALFLAFSSPRNSRQGSPHVHFRLEFPTIFEGLFADARLLVKPVAPLEWQFSKIPKVYTSS